jgi:3-dehydroquinate synthase
MTTSDSRNIVLTGFMGTGKTTVGRLLAERLGFEFVDTDQVIEQRHGKIADIFRSRGEQAFREIEHELAIELAARDRTVISTGGRLMLDPRNVASLSRNARVFCLVATPDEIFERVANDETSVARPMLAVPDPRRRIVELLAERSPGYRRFAQLMTDSVRAEAVADDLAVLARSDPHRFAIDNPSGGYEFSVGAAVLPFTRQLAHIDGPMVVVTSTEVAELYLASCGIVDVAITLPDRHKNLAAVQHVYDSLLDANVDRSATIVALGDSDVGDVAGFAAATYFRGVDLVHCPTDLVAMIDTSIGGKIGLDVPQGKNLIGLFKQPRAVVADVATLQTLSRRQFSSGMAEVVKHALIAGSQLLSKLEAGEWHGLSHEAHDALGRLQTLVAQAIQVKIAIVQDDPFEASRRAVLNLGHTFAYSFEQVGGDALTHGEAVGVGLVAAARVSERVGLASSGLADRVESLLHHVGLSTKLPVAMPVDALVDAMRRDKKRQGDTLRFILLRDVGDPLISEDVPADTVAGVLAGLQPVSPTEHRATSEGSSRLGAEATGSAAEEQRTDLGVVEQGGRGSRQDDPTLL